MKMDEFTEILDTSRELATEKRIVRIKGFDGLKHNFHPDIFKKLSTKGLAKFFPEQELLSKIDGGV